jgi:hypothetical protein
LINALRARAGKWKFNNAENAEKTDDYSAALVAATPVVIDINYILDERSREYFGEGYRWHDLARTQKWAEYAGEYQVCTSAGDPVPETTPGYRLNGDQSHQGRHLRIEAGDWNIQHIKLYRYE